MAGRPKYPRQKVIAVDVDDTLIVNGLPNAALIEWLECRKAEGFSLTLWSMRGREHAHRAAVLSGTVELFDAITSKPGYIVDDKGWGWIQYTHVVKGEDIAQAVSW